MKKFNIGCVMLVLVAVLGLAACTTSGQAVVPTLGAPSPYTG